MNDPAPCSSESLGAIDLWSKQGLASLWLHLHNDNPPSQYVIGLIDKSTKGPKYVKPGVGKLSAHAAISWGVDTVAGRAKNPLAFVPYSQNKEQLSRWGALDFDAHDGTPECVARARNLAHAAYERLRYCELGAILEGSGRGFHVWTISPDFKPISHWLRLLKGVAGEIGATVGKGSCELFPPEAKLRAPGAWNPTSQTASLILAHNTAELVAQLPLYISGKWRPVYSDTSLRLKKVSLSSLCLDDWAKVIKGVESFCINQPATRRKQLQGLTGHVYHQVAHSVAEQMARAQFAEKTVTTNADAGEHLEDFSDLWRRLEDRWRASLSPSESEHFAKLSTDAEEAAFRIIKSYARDAVIKEGQDFMVAVENLGKRIGITREGAGLLRRKFVKLGIIQETAPFRKNVTPARYRWLLSNNLTAHL